MADEPGAQRPRLFMANRGGRMSRVNRYANGSRRRRLRARLKAQGLPCAICGGPIDYDLPAGDPMSFEVDEIIPVSLGGSPTDPDNVQPAHRICNQRKSNKLGFTVEQPSGEPGRAAGGGQDIGTSFDWSAPVSS